MYTCIFMLIQYILTFGSGEHNFSSSVKNGLQCTHVTTANRTGVQTVHSSAANVNILSRRFMLSPLLLTVPLAKMFIKMYLYCTFC